MILGLNIGIFTFLYTLKILFARDFVNDDKYQCRLGTTTPYRCVANGNDTPIHFEGCTEKKIWLIIRHGTRYPDKKHISGMKDRLSKVQSMILKNHQLQKTLLQTEDVDSLEKWEFYLNESLGENLVREGEDEMIDLGERYQTRFPTLMPETYSNKTYKFKFTNTQRTRESAKHFAIGLFGHRRTQQIWYPEAEDKDPVLRFYTRCERWKTEIKKGKKTFKEMTKFLAGTEVQSALKRISQVLGDPVDVDTVRSMAEICFYETAWKENYESPWCKIFTIEDFKVLEFLIDLKHYWQDGYGYDLNYQQACPAMQDMFKFFESDDETKVTAYFTHSGTILKLLSFLGIARDGDTLRSDNYFKYGNTRAWRTSAIDTTGSNIAFIEYQCESKEPHILTMHQEKIVNLGNCPKNEPCPLSTMKAMYRKTNNGNEECEFNKICAIPKQQS